MAVDEVIVGGGRIGNALYEMGGKSATLVGREDSIPAEGNGPIYVCTRNDDLVNVINRTPENRREDLLFLQNGVLAELLEEQGLSDCSQGLVYFAVAKQGEAPIDGITDKNPEGLTSATGKWAGAFKDLLAKGGLTCHVVGRPTFNARMFEKHIWICSLMLVGTKHKCSVGEVESAHTAEVTALMTELKNAIVAEHGVSFEAGVEERLLAYARSVAHYPTAVKELEWRNGYFSKLSEAKKKEGRPDPCPLHSAMLEEVNAV